LPSLTSRSRFSATAAHLLAAVALLAHGAPQSATSVTQVKRIFVGSLGTTADAQATRNALISALRKHREVVLADSPDRADAVLTGSGEVWVKGYYSLNPRMRTPGEDAHPIYGGFLSVELKGRQNEVLWSYLVTPRRSGPGEVGRNLAGQIVKKLCEALLPAKHPV